MVDVDFWLSRNMAIKIKNKIAALIIDSYKRGSSCDVGPSGKCLGKIDDVDALAGMP